MYFNYLRLANKGSGAILNNASLASRQSRGGETMRRVGRSLIMEVPTAAQANDLRSLALQLRTSASQTKDESYIDLFLCAALALEARAGTATLAVPHQT